TSSVGRSGTFDQLAAGAPFKNWHEASNTEKPKARTRVNPKSKSLISILSSVVGSTSCDERSIAILGLPFNENIFDVRDRARPNRAASHFSTGRDAALRPPRREAPYCTSFRTAHRVN